MSQHPSLKSDNYDNVDNNDNSNNVSVHSNLENEFHDSDLNMKQLLMNFDENEPIFDNDLLYPTPKESEIVHFNDDSTLIQGTVEALITYITSPELLNYQYLVDFFLTFRTYIDPLPLLELLLCRLSWCLKKSLSTHKEESTTGKLVLIRTFVTIRHWLLNYFQDDFVSDPILRTLFTNTINELSKYDRYIGNDKSNIQSKIIKDLKKNYIILSSLFWDIKIEDDYDIDLLNYKISSYDDFDDSRLSMMGSSQLRDPSVRRSNLLSMFDNPSSSNIINESVKNKITDTSTYDRETPLETFLNKKSKLRLNDENKKVQNFVLYPKDSLNALDTPKMKSYADDNSSIDLLYNTLCKNEPVSGFIPLDKSNIIDSFSGGFTIRGNIEVFQDSKVNKISPLVLRNPSPNMKKQNVGKIETRTATPKPKAVPFKESSNILSSKPKKKGFLKSMFNTNSNNKENNLPKNYDAKSNSSIDFSKNYNAFTKQSDTTNSNNKQSNNLIFKLEKQINIDGNNLDYLEDIVIRDYQIMIQHPNFKQRYSKQIRNSNRKSVLSMAFNFGGDNESKFDPLDSPIKRNNMAYYPGQLEKSINLNNGHNNKAYFENEKSFQTPPDTLDWSNSLNVDETNDNVFVNMGLSNDEIQDVSVLEYTLNSNNQNCYRQDLNHKRSSLQNIRSDVSRFSHISKKEKYNSDSNILRNNNGSGFINILKSTNNSYFANSDIVLSNRTSFKIFGRSSLRSNKSYLTYDSNFSESTSEAHNKNNCDDDDQGIKLKKKNAILNLRVDNHEKNISFQNEQDTKAIVQEKDHAKIIHDQQHNFFIDNNDAISNMLENFDETNSINDGNLREILHVFEELPYFDDIQSMNTLSSGISILPSPTPSQACYNGLSQTDIKELAAIPAEKLEGDPLNYTLSKLRGERKKFKVIVGLNDDEQNDDEVHRKHAVTVVCQSPTKKDSKYIYNTLNDAYNNNDENDSNDEVKLEQQVRDLYISSNPNDVGNRNLSRNNSKLEMNMITRQSLNRTKENSSVLTRVSTGKLLRDDGEKSCFDLQSLSATPRAFDNAKLILSVEEILEKELHIPFIFRYETDKLAAQMTLIERDIILEVEWKELINLKWDQPLTPYNSWLKLLLDLSNKTGLELITLRFNLVNNWIISEILLCKNFTLRVLAITRFIELAHKCRQIQNYGTLFQIMLALNSEVMKKLKSTWIRVDPATILKFKELKDLTSPNNNFKNYRDEIENIVPSKGFIPFLPLALSDLTMYSEMPTIINSNPEILNELDSLSEFDTSSAVNYDLINFEKFRVIGETVKDTLRHIEWSKFFNFQIDKKIISKCLYISSLSEEDMTLCLKEIEM